MPSLGTLSSPPPRLGVLGSLRARLLGVPAVSSKRKAVAVSIALCADLLQLVIWPAFAGGAVSPFDDALDFVVAIALWITLGWSPRLALALALELTPGADLFPTWTAVVATIPAQPARAQPTPADAALPPRG